MKSLKNLFFLLIALGSFVVGAQQVSAQVQDCTLGNESSDRDITMNPVGQQNQVFDPANPLNVEIAVYFKGTCTGYSLDLAINEMDFGTFSDSYTNSNQIPLDYGIFVQRFTAGTLECEDHSFDDCAYTAEVTLRDPAGNEVASDSTTIELEFDIEPAGAADLTIPWIPLDVDWSQNTEITPCRATETQIFNVDPTNGSVSPITPGLQPSSFYKDDEQPIIMVQQRIRDCGKKSGEVVGPRHNWKDGAYFNVLSDYILQNRVTTPYDDLLVKMTYILGDEECGVLDDSFTGYDDMCRLVFPTRSQAENFTAGFGNTEVEQDDIEVSSSYYNAFSNTGGFITYACDGECDTEWGAAPTVEAARCMNADCSQTEPIEIASNQFLAGYLLSIQDSPCYVPPSNPNDPTDIGTIKPDCYELLAPLPGLTALGVPLSNDTNAGFENGVYTTEFSLGFWVNRIITFLIGIVGLAAVVMIIFAGVQYMTTEAIGKKSDAKERITQALIGLVIALGIFVILSTINPDLLDVDPDIEEITLEFDDATEVPVTVNPDGSVTSNLDQCSGGAPDVNVGCPTCIGFTDSEFPNKISSDTYQTILPEYKTKLANFKNAIINHNNNNGLQLDIEAIITEAFPPGGFANTPPRAIHCSQCHYNGTCTDIALRYNGDQRVSGLDAQTVAPLIQEFISLAQQSGLRAEYELKPGQRCIDIEALMPSSFPASAIKCVPHITAEHFSVYNN